MVAIATLGLAEAGMSQGLDLGGGDGGPIEIEADNGIEWRRGARTFQARGNARAKRGEVEVFADVLRAHYREKPNGGTEVFRLDADGNVRIVSPSETAYAQKGVYDVDKAVLVLSGDGGVRLVSGSDEITADRQVEYWQNRRLAVARGNAVAVSDDRRLRADVLTAHFRADGEGKSSLSRVEAFDNVVVRTADERVTAQRGVYNAQSGKAVLAGAVRITRGGNQLNGCRAEIDLNTGISRLLGCEDGGEDERVRGLIVPKGDGPPEVFGN